MASSSLFVLKLKKEAINYARPHLNNKTKIEVLTVETKIRVEKTEEYNDNCIFNRRIIIFGSLYDKYLYYSQILRE